MYTPSPSAFATLKDAPDPAGSEADARARRQLGLLEELADMGMEIARAVHRQATAQSAAGGEAGDPPFADPVLAFTRVSRAVRLTLALETRVQEQIDARRAAASSARTSWSAETMSAVETFKRRLFAVAGRPDEDDDGAARCEIAEIGWRALRERLVETDDEADDETGTEAADERRPVGEIIGDICRSLGVKPDWSLWAQEDAAGEGSIAPPLATPTEPVLSDATGGVEGGDFDSDARASRPLRHVARGPPPQRGGGGIGEDAPKANPP